MDDNQFDRLTRVMAASSRREVLKRGIGAIVGGVLAVSGLSTADAGSKRGIGQTCRKNGDCGSGLCGARDATGRSLCACKGAGDCTAPRNACDLVTCTPAGTCLSTPKNCNDNNACTIDSCDPRTGACINTTIDCDDNDACTIDTCDSQTGQCVHTPKVCDDQNLCTTDTCNSQTGECVYTPKVCNDNNICTVDSCNPQTGDCIFESTSVDCVVGPFFATTVCNARCGVGQQTYTRSVVTPAACDGDECPALTEQRSCTAAICGPCTADCSNGSSPFTVLFKDGAQACTYNFTTSPSLCCASDSDCPNTAPFCVTSLTLFGASPVSTVCSTDAAKGTCATLYSACPG